MQVIKDSEFGGERPLFGSHNLRLENVTIHAGESAIKNCSNIEAYNCRFEGKYPFWHVKGFKVENCLFTEGARAALWYSSGLEMRNTRVEAPKMFREMSDLILDHVEIPDAQETLWHCRKATLSHVTLAKGDYLFMHGADIRISDYKHQGNYSFQYCKNVEIRNADIDSKDAFWNTEDVTLINCRLTGEYLGWHSHRLKLVRCHISGTQPLCYAHDLILEDCTFDPACDLAFEDSSVNATIKGGLASIKNPKTGRIELDSVGEIILDGNAIAPADCEIVVKGK